jgi:rhodanese-related sulfurtransferase
LGHYWFEIEPEWVAEHAGEVLLIDVRQRDEFDERLGCIQGAHCIALSELRDRLTEIPTDRPVVTVCHAGTRSAQATVILRQAGFVRVANLRGGMLLWQQMGLPVQLRGADAAASQGA